MPKEMTAGETITIKVSDLPAGMTPDKIAKATAAYDRRQEYQKTHNVARRMAQQRVAKLHEDEYKRIYKEELTKAKKSAGITS